jgi:ribonuclease HI
VPADPGLLTVSCDGAARGNPGPAGIGVQITDSRLGEARFYALAHAFEQATDWHKREPALA